MRFNSRVKDIFRKSDARVPRQKIAKDRGREFDREAR